MRRLKSEYLTSMCFRCTLGVKIHFLFTSLSSLYLNNAVLIILCVLYFWSHCPAMCQRHWQKGTPIFQLVPSCMWCHSILQICSTSYDNVQWCASVSVACCCEFELVLRFSERIQNICRLWNWCGSHWEEKSGVSFVYDWINGVARIWLQVYATVAMGMLWVWIQAYLDYGYRHACRQE